MSSRFEILPEPVLEESYQHWVIPELRERNVKRKKNAIVLVSGDTGSGKTRLISALIEKMDPLFTPSLRNPAGVNRHLSISPLYFLLALQMDLLPPYSWWLLDEPTDVDATDWYTLVARVLRDFLTLYRFKIVNLALCTPLIKRPLGFIRDLSHVWIEMVEPGTAKVKKMRTVTDYKSSARLQFRRPKFLGMIEKAAMPSTEFEELYEPIKQEHWQKKADEDIALLRKKGYIT